MVSRNCIYSDKNYWLKITKIFLDAMNHEERVNIVKEKKKKKSFLQRIQENLLWLIQDFTQIT
jgi:hypothetical protein